MRNHKLQTICFALLLSAAITVHRDCCAASFDLSTLPSSRANEFKVSAKEMLLRPGHIYNFSGSITVRPDVQQFGFGGSFSPPYLASPFQANWKYDNQKIRVSDYVWYPSQTILSGQLTKDVQVSQSLIPLAGQRAFVCKLVLENKGSALFETQLAFEMNGNIAKEQTWGWVPPSRAGSKINVSIQENAFVLSAEQSEMTVIFEPHPVSSDGNDKAALFAVKLKPNESREIVAVVVLGRPGQTLNCSRTLLAQLPEKITQTQQDWDNKLLVLESRLPRLTTDKEKLKQFYRRCLLTFLTTQWTLEESVFTPWYSESGIDGGAVCNYLWAEAYISKFLTLADPASTRALLLTSMKADYSSHYAVNFARGEGLGVGYSYDYYSMAILAYDYIVITGDRSLFGETVRGKPFIDALYEYVFEREDMTAPPVLIDYGINENLLELQRTMAYQHYTPSPNLERISSHQILDKLFRMAGRKSPVDFNRRADQLRQVIIDQLWDEQLKWFHCRDKEQKQQLCYSIQIFDMLRSGVLSHDQAKGLVGHLNEQEFLSQWGVHSMSKKDPGYDPSDIDWGGPGVYAGDAPELITDLCQAGFATEGIDLLERILWWGELPYIPQALRADVRDYRQNGRPNIIAALAGPQAIVCGLFGLRIEDQKLTINPVNHPFVAGMKVENITIWGKKIAIVIDSNGRNYAVDVDGRKTRKKIGQPFELRLTK